jgi:hypothetical protein
MPHLFTELRRQLAGRKDVRDPAKLAAYIKARLHGSNPPLRVRVVGKFVQVWHGSVIGYFDPRRELALIAIVRSAGQAREPVIQLGHDASPAERTWLQRQHGEADVAPGTHSQQYLEGILEDGEVHGPNPLLAIAGNPAKRRGGHGANPGGGAKPTPGGVVFGTGVDQLKYQHATEGPRVHQFTKKGTKLEALRDGSVRIFNPKCPVWEEEG